MHMYCKYIRYEYTPASVMTSAGRAVSTTPQLFYLQDRIRHMNMLVVWHILPYHSGFQERPT
jgi:hypothetical protein